MIYKNYCKLTNEKMEEYTRVHSEEIDGCAWEGTPIRELSHDALLGVAHQLGEDQRRQYQQRVKEYDMFEDLRKAREENRGFWLRLFYP